MSDTRRRLIRPDGIWRYRICSIRGEWWDHKILVTLWTPGGRQIYLRNKDFGLSDDLGPTPKVTPGMLAKWIEENPQ